MMLSWCVWPVFSTFPRTVVSEAACIGSRVLVRIAQSFETHEHRVRRTFDSEIVLLVSILRSDADSRHLGFWLRVVRSKFNYLLFSNVWRQRIPTPFISPPRSKSLRTSGRWGLHFQCSAPARNWLFKIPWDLTRALLQKFRRISWGVLADLCERFPIPLKP